MRQVAKMLLPMQTLKDIHLESRRHMISSQTDLVQMRREFYFGAPKVVESDSDFDNDDPFGFKKDRAKVDQSDSNENLSA